jgi:hypothetical protein
VPGIGTQVGSPGSSHALEPASLRTNEEGLVPARPDLIRCLGRNSELRGFANLEGPRNGQAIFGPGVPRGASVAGG